MIRDWELKLNLLLQIKSGAEGREGDERRGERGKRKEEMKRKRTRKRKGKKALRSKAPGQQSPASPTFNIFFLWPLEYLSTVDMTKSISI